MKAALKNLVDRAGGVNHVAHTLGVREATIYNWLRKGDLSGVTAGLALEAAKVLGVPLETLVGGEKR